MSEITIYHGKPEGLEPPKQIIKEAVENASESTPSPAFCVADIAHHAEINMYRKDFGVNTRGQSVLALCDPETGDNVKKSDVTQETLSAIESNLRSRLGAGHLSVVNLSESLRVDTNNKPKLKPEVYS